MITNNTPEITIPVIIPLLFPESDIPSTVPEMKRCQFDDKTTV